MGIDRRKYQDKSKAEVSVKLREEFKITTMQAYETWKEYHKCKNDGMNILDTTNYLFQEYQKNILKYFVALALEIVTKEVIEGIKVDKKES
jgi:hypothetical protein